jgi:hypothetical protein
MNRHVVLFEWNYINAQLVTVVLMNDSHDMAMSGDCSRQDEDVVENGPTASVCCVVLSEDE